MFPIEKYKFYTNGSRVIAVSTYAGRVVRGVAVCHADDEFSLEKGKQLAALRCAEKIATKRMKRATAKKLEARRIYDDAVAHYSDMADYENEAAHELHEVMEAKREFLKTL